MIKPGPGVSGLKEGDRVSGGALGFDGRANVPATQLHVINDLPQPDELCILEPIACAVTGLDHCLLRPGDRVTLIGCGFMGAMILQGLLRSFAERVMVIEKDPVRLKLAQRLGAKDVWNPSHVNWPERLQELQALGVDTVVDCTGVQAGLDLATQICRCGGRINLFGWNKGSRTVDASHWHMQGLTVVNSSPSAASRDPFPVAIRMLRAGIIDLEPLVTHVVPLEEYPACSRKL